MAINPLTAIVQYKALSAKIHISIPISIGFKKKSFYERCDYVSVNDESLCICPEKRQRKKNSCSRELDGSLLKLI